MHACAEGQVNSVDDGSHALPDCSVPLTLGLYGPVVARVRASTSMKYSPGVTFDRLTSESPLPPVLSSHARSVELQLPTRTVTTVSSADPSVSTRRVVSANGRLRR